MTRRLGPARHEQLDPLLGQEPLVAQQGEHLVTERLLGRCERQRYEPPLAVPSAPRGDRVHVRVPVEQVASGLHHPDHPGPHCPVAGGGHQLSHHLPADAAEAAADLVTVVTMSVQKAMEKATWCFLSCDLNQAIVAAERDLRSETRAEAKSSAASSVTTPTRPRRR